MILFCIWYLTYKWWDDKWKGIFLLPEYGIKFKAKSATIFMLQIDQVYHCTLANWGGEQFAMVFLQRNICIKSSSDECKIMQNTNPLIPPIFGYDEYGYCLEWNASMEKFTWWKRQEILFTFSLHFVAMPTLSMFVNGWQITLWIF